MKQTNQIEEGILLARILSCANLKLRELVSKRCAKLNRANLKLSENEYRANLNTSKVYMVFEKKLHIL